MKSPLGASTQMLLYSSTLIAMASRRVVLWSRRRVQIEQPFRLLLMIAKQLAQPRFADLQERIGQRRIELRARASLDFSEGHFKRQRLAIRSTGGHRVEAIRKTDDATEQRDIFA